MIAPTKPIGTLRMGPLARICSSNPATPAIVLWPAARVSGVILVGDAELCQRSPPLGIGHRPAHPVLPEAPKLLTRFCTRGKARHCDTHMGSGEGRLPELTL
jgi:hypothetical protein